MGRCRPAAEWALLGHGRTLRAQTHGPTCRPSIPSSRYVSLLGDDQSRRNRYSADAVGYEVGPFSRLALTAYYQEFAHQQDTRSPRQHYAACPDGPGSVRCLREARFRYEAPLKGLIASGSGASLARPRASRRRRRGVLAHARTPRSARPADPTEHRCPVPSVVGRRAVPARDFPVSETERFGGFVQDSGGRVAAHLDSGLRFDAFRLRPRADELFAASSGGREVASLSDEAISPKLGILFRASDALTLNGQIATGFRAPPASDLNIGLTSLPSGYSVIANPALKPESSRGAEIGARLNAGAAEAMVTAFYTRYSDLIVSRAALPCPSDPRCTPGATGTFQSQNVSSARITASKRSSRGVSRRAGPRARRSRFRAARHRQGRTLNAIDPARVVAGLG